MTLHINHNIKLVIWDMDETLWHGTLSEEPVVVVDKNITIIQELTSRGIVNSICSKNNEDSVKIELINIDIWNNFVFNKISWDAKGQQIKETLSEMNLRACNVLFIDDNKSNLEEARFYNEGIYTATPDKINYLLAHPMLQGKSDCEHSRLKHYKLLENKKISMNKLKISNKEFLQTSGIQINVSNFELKYLGRVAELIERSNQLNFTKLRSGKDSLYDLLDSDDIDARVIHVVDNFGNYGLCGFYAVKDNKAIHFLFSCRVMGMGIESWCYHHIGCPELETIGDVSVKLMIEKPNWIKEKNKFISKEKTFKPSTSSRVLLSGGCDLQQIGIMLEKYFCLQTEFNYMKDGVNVRKDHTELILTELTPKLESEIEKIPFLSKESIGSRMFSDHFDAVVISPLMDFHQGCYENKHNGVIIPKDSFEIDLTKLKCLDTKRIQKYGEEFLKWFSRNYKFIGPLSPEKFKNNIIQIKSRLSENCELFCLTAAEVDYKYPKIDFTYLGLESQHYDRHCRMNSALEELQDIGILELIDIRGIIRDEDDLESSNIYHYTRKNYNNLSIIIRDHLIDKLFLNTKIKKPPDNIIGALKRRLMQTITRIKKLT
tara:strand:- start:491 stop:2296 length:1806 start_codon:yes stop_codon:yes gene_type:complete